ncbi:MAG: hypothetical protein ABI846_03335 [Rudaea sp.]
MSTPLNRIASLLALTVLVAACGKSEEQAKTATPAPAAVVAPAATPDAAIMASVRAMRANDINGLLTASLPAPELAKMKADWSKNLSKDPITEEDRKKFNDQMAKLTAPGAEDKLYAEAEPQLKKFDQESAAQMPMLIAMGQGFVQSSIQQSKDMSEEQKKQAGALVDAAGKWAQSVKFTDPTLVKGAIAVVCKTARDLNLKSLDEVRALSYDQGMIKAGIAVGGLKQLLAVYGLQVDRSLDSVKAETISNAGDAAKVKISYSAFDQPFATEGDLVRVDGRWYGKEAIEKWHKQQAEAAAATANPPAQTTK